RIVQLLLLYGPGAFTSNISYQPPTLVPPLSLSGQWTSRKRMCQLTPRSSLKRGEALCQSHHELAPTASSPKCAFSESLSSSGCFVLPHPVLHRSGSQTYSLAPQNARAIIFSTSYSSLMFSPTKCTGRQHWKW
ncbi:hypothetical protein OF83DRAFT_1156104, partial [Amylostereum chailletii]